MVLERKQEKSESILEWSVWKTLAFFIHRRANWIIHLYWIKSPPANAKLKAVCDIISKKPDNSMPFV